MPLGNPEDNHPGRQKRQNQGYYQGQNKLLTNTKFSENHFFPEAS